MIQRFKSPADFLLTLDLETIKELAVDLEGNLTTKLLNWERYAEEATASYTEEEKEEFYEHHIDEAHKYIKEQPQLIRKSLFIQTFFLFENFLFQLCDHYKMTKDYKVRHKDMHGQGIERAKLYLSKICLIQEPFSTDSWNKIKAYSEVRNSIAHSNSVMKKDVSLIGFEKDVIHSRGNKYTFVLNEDFVDNFIDVINDFKSKF